MKRIQPYAVKLLSLAVAVAALMTFLPCSALSYEAEAAETIRIAYIPIDNRPVNVDRVKYLAAASGIELLMPDEDLYRTALDNMEPNSNGTTYGDRAALTEWLKQVEKDGCDYYALSVDQLLSGGLVGSRWFSNTDLSFEYSVADYIAELAANNNVVLFDTVMRLASTVGYQGYEMDEYTKLRTYGAADRKKLTGSALTVENIVNGYRYDTNGGVIWTDLAASAVDSYLASRRRKLMLTDYIIENTFANIGFCYIGVDDSANGNTVQTNEIAYIRSKLGDKGACFAATDELGLMAVTRIVCGIRGAADINVTYYGGAENNMADAYDFETLKTNVSTHISSLGCAEKASADALQVLVFTNGSNHESAAKALVADARENILNNIPTVIIDPTNGAGGSTLELALIRSGIPLALFMGYSNWNTAGNAMGIALANGVARYVYLRSVDTASDESNKGFLRMMTFSYLKDISYKRLYYPITDTGFGEGSYRSLIKLINSSDIVTSLKPYRQSGHGTVSAFNYRYPWNRTFEMTFDIGVGSYTDKLLPGAYAPGDVNGDTFVNASDYILQRLHLLGVSRLSGNMLSAADADGNGKTDSLDFIRVRLRILGME